MNRIFCCWHWDLFDKLMKDFDMYLFIAIRQRERWSFLCCWHVVAILIWLKVCLSKTNRMTNRIDLDIVYLIRMFFIAISLRFTHIKSHLLLTLQISIEMNNLFFIYQNISNFRWNSCQHDWMTTHLNDNHHDVSFSFEQLRQSTRHCLFLNQKLAQQDVKTSARFVSSRFEYHSQS